MNDKNDPVSSYMHNQLLRVYAYLPAFLFPAFVLCVSDYLDVPGVDTQRIVTSMVSMITLRALFSS